ncbi:MAG: 5-formyltetrahydrofolate cyclo-ligase [Anaerocolumna sp.]
MLKQGIRKLMKDLKSMLEEADRAAYSKNILERLYQSPEYKKCSRIFSYVSFNQEVITTDLIMTALSQKKKVAVPKITGDGMKFYYINSIEDLQPGILGILEPVTTKEAAPYPFEDNLIIVPGLAFDKHKNRIGYGRGYYDGFFSKFNNYPLEKIALAFDFQVLSELPAEGHDIKVDQIITQSYVIK